MNKLTHIPRLLGILMAGSLLACNTHAAITNNLVVHLTFDSNYNDSSGNNNNGTAVGNPTFQTGILGKAVSVTTKKDGSEFDYVTLNYPNQLLFANNVDFSVSFWTSYTNQVDDPPFISNKNWSSSGNPGWGIFTQGGGNIRVNATDDAGHNEGTTGTPVIRDGKWHLVTVSFVRTGNATVYVDGALATTFAMTAMTGSIDTLSSGLTVNIGQDGTGGYTDGGSAEMVDVLIDDLGIWTRALLPSEVSAIYNAGLAGKDLAHVPAPSEPVLKSTSPLDKAIGVAANATVTAVITDGSAAVNPSSISLALNGTALSVTPSKSGADTTVSFTPTALWPAGTNTAVLIFADNGTPANKFTNTWAFKVSSYTAIPATAALPASAVDTTQSGFIYRVHQIDSATANVLAANVAHAEAQLAGLLIDPASGSAYPNIATAGTQPDGSSIITNLINFSFDLTAEQGAFTTANGYPDAAYPGITGQNSDNMAGEIIGYLDLKAGFYTFAVNATDGFRLTVAANPYDVLGTTLGLFDYRGITTETKFGVAVQQAGIYPVRLLWYRMTAAPDNIGNASLEFYTVNPDGTKVLVNDSSKATAVKAYWKRTAGYGTFVKYAGPSAFASPFLDSSDVGFTNVVVKISDGTTNKVDVSTVKLTVDGTVITNATVNPASGITTVSYVPAGLQLPRMVHPAQLTYKDQSGASYSSSWNFHLLRNYVLPTALYTEDFESTPAGPNPTVPTGWVEENHTDTDVAGLDTANLHSDFYLGWVVVDKSFAISKDTGVSAFAPQVLNGVAFDENTNPLLVNHYIRAESDVRSGYQVQYLTTKSYDLTGKTGVVVAFDSSYEQNQNSIVALEYSIDKGTNWLPILYWLQGDSDNQDATAIIHDGLGNVDVGTTLLTPNGANGAGAPRYTDPASGTVIGGYYGAFIKTPITAGLASYIEGRMNDDGSESKRFEAYHAPLADNQPDVRFRFTQAGHGSWYWCIDNWGIYSVPSIAVTPPTQPGPLSAAFQNGKVVVSWTGGGTLQTTKSLPGTWTDVPSSTSPYSVSPTGAAAFYRLRQ
jgi:Concanavalin A-like lectin/glucanases superfamily